jgi:hypothetical protein
MTVDRVTDDGIKFNSSLPPLLSLSLTIYLQLLVSYYTYSRKLPQHGS